MICRTLLFVATLAILLQPGCLPGRINKGLRSDIAADAASSDTAGETVDTALADTPGTVDTGHGDIDAIDVTTFDATPEDVLDVSDIQPDLPDGAADTGDTAHPDMLTDTTEVDLLDAEQDTAQLPITTILSGPNTKTTERDAKFTLECDAPPCKFQCQLDGGIWIPCSAAQNYNELGAGEHTFKVQAEKDGVFENTPKQHVWTILAFSSVTIGQNNTCALVNDGSLWCWGDNTNGQLGYGSADEKDQLVPLQIGQSQWDSLSFGLGHACALSSGKLYCWGSDSSFQLGLGGSGDQHSPKQVKADATWTAITAGGGHTCAIKEGALYCWGDAQFGQVGHGVMSSEESVSEPLKIEPDTDWATVSIGYESSCAIKTNKKLYCWGLNPFVSSPTKVNDEADWKQVSVGASHTCAVKTDGRLYCWGDKKLGKLGHSIEGTTPTQVGTANTWAKVSIGGTHSCAIKDDDTLWCWGNNADGQLGTDIGEFTSTDTPTRVGLAKWKLIGAGLHHTCGIKTDDTLWCWGKNSHGQLGFGQKGSSVPAPVPVQLPIP